MGQYATLMAPKRNQVQGLESSQQTRFLRTGTIELLCQCIPSGDLSCSQISLLNSCDERHIYICNIQQSLCLGTCFTRHHIKIGKRMQNGTQKSGAVEPDTAICRKWCHGFSTEGCILEKQDVCSNILHYSNQHYFFFATGLLVQYSQNTVLLRLACGTSQRYLLKKNA